MQGKKWLSLFVIHGKRKRQAVRDGDREAPFGKKMEVTGAVAELLRSCRRGREGGERGREKEREGERDAKRERERERERERGREGGR